jgi:hypothetical protein
MGVCVPTSARLHAGKHVSANSRIMDICSNGNAPQERNDVERKCISHAVYCRVISRLRRWAKGVPMNRSGISLDKASHARYIDPRLCPKRVKRGQVESSTR